MKWVNETYTDRPAITLPFDDMQYISYFRFDVEDHFFQAVIYCFTLLDLEKKLLNSILNR